VKERVAAARERQAHRARRLGLSAPVNALLTDGDIGRVLPPDSPACRLIDRMCRRADMAPADRRRVLRVAITIADLEGVGDVDERHLTGAVALADPEGPGLLPGP
jgi:magnesium chelatase family protein